MNNDNTLNNLRMLANKNASFEDPFEKNPTSKKREFKKPQKKKQSISSFITDSEEYLKESYSGNDFDLAINSLDYDEDDLELRDSILSMGRKYARDYAASSDESEVSKAFAPQEARLNDLYSSCAKEIMKLEEDINEMRMARSRNFGKISDMVEVKATLFSHQLGVIKEINKMKKDQFDIRNKMKEDKLNDSDSSAAASSVIQSIFGMGHDTLLNSVGGRAGSSGAYIEDEESSIESSDDYGEMVISRNETEPETETDGDKFIKYEGMNIQYVLEENEDHERTIYAEDDEGNVIEDYPIASDVNELVFDINQKTGTATDQLQRKYIYRTV